MPASAAILQLREQISTLKKRVSGQYWRAYQAKQNPSLFSINPVNPISLNLHAPDNFCDKEFMEIQNQLRLSVKLVVTVENLAILKTYYEKRKTLQDALAQLYQTLSFDDFILRLYNKRYSKSGQENISIGFYRTDANTNHDPDNEYRYYLTQEEMAFSHLVLPLALSAFIGTGISAPHKMKKHFEDFTNAIDLGCISYPSGVEFLQGQSSSTDMLMLTPVNPADHHNAYPHFPLKFEMNKAVQPVLEAIYGVSNIDANADNALVLVGSNKGDRCYRLNKAMYMQRIKNTLRALLLASDREMKASGLGTTFQLKALGQHKSGFPDFDLELERLYVQAVKEVINEIHLHHITCINIINLPSMLKENYRRQEFFQEIPSAANVRLIKSVMSSTDKTKSETIGEIGGTLFCGNSASLAGGNLSFIEIAGNSDNYAQLYAMMTPTMFDPTVNRSLLSKHCIYISDNAKETLEPLFPRPIVDETIILEPLKAEPTLNEKMHSYFEHVNQLKSKKSFTEYTIDWIKKANHPEILALFEKLNNSSLGFLQRSHFKSGLFYRMRSHEKNKTWDKILQAMKARVMLDLFSSSEESNQYFPITLQYDALLSAHRKHHWFDEEATSKKRYDRFFKSHWTDMKAYRKTELSCDKLYRKVFFSK